jgi:3-hydroxypropanoate dehydrogenase
MKPELDSIRPRTNSSAQAHTFNKFSDQPVSEQTIRELYELLKWGPTSMNAQPGRYVFLKQPCGARAADPGDDRRQRRKDAQGAADRDRGHGYAVLRPPAERSSRPTTRARCSPTTPLSEATAFRNSSLQGAYLMLAARALGLDCGPMSGFDPAKVDAEFFPDGRWKSNFIINMGYGLEAGGHYPRGPRLGFEEAAQVL